MLDNKRWLCDDGVHTLAFGHHSIPAGAVVVEDRDGQVGLARYADERISARIPINRAPPSPAASPLPPPDPFANVPAAVVECIIYCAMKFTEGQALPPAPFGLPADEFSVLVNQARASLVSGTDEQKVSARVLACIDAIHSGDDDAYVDALLSL